MERGQITFSPSGLERLVSARDVRAIVKALDRIAAALERLVVLQELRRE
jgi:hypothetical protein